MSSSDDEDAPVPGDYTAEDGWDDQNGLEQCPRCETVMSANGGWFGAVFDQDGNRYESIYAAEPGEGPYFCAECWKVLAANRTRGEHHDLGEFA